MKKQRPFEIHSILESLRRDILSGKITKQQAAEELYDAGWTTFVDLKKTEKLLSIG